MGQTKLTAGWAEQGQPSQGPAPKVKLAYSVREFCRETSIGKTMLYELVKAGKIKITKVGTRSIITGPEATRFLKEGA
jgi:excisionase family DNA binding protein